MDRAIPSTLEECTPRWLTDALRSRGVISDGSEITGREIEILGAGEGFMGELARMTLTYGPGSGPTTLVAKIPTAVEENRQGGELLGVYEREIRIYEEVLPDLDLDLPVPLIYYSAIEVNPGAETRLDSLARLERLPIWMIRVVIGLFQRFVKPATFESVLLLEDLAPATIGDQVVGCGVDRAAAALDVVAELHAATWGDAKPEESYWLLSFAMAPRLVHAGTLGARRRFLRRFGHLFSEHTRTLLKRASKGNLKRHRRLAEDVPQCLLHGDYRLDNMFFTDDEVSAVIDWQVTNIGPAVIDVAYFITGALPRETPESDIDGLLIRYHAALVAAGVDDYPLDSFMADYDDALLILLPRMASIEMLDFGEDRGVDLVESWLRRLDARVARVSI